MNEVTKPHDWSQQLELFSKQNLGRRTRLGVFEPNEDAVTDYWVENGLPFEEIVMEFRDGSATIAIILRDLTHTINNARKIEFHASIDRNDDGLNVTDSDGRTTFLRFE